MNRQCSYDNTSFVCKVRVKNFLLKFPKNIIGKKFKGVKHLGRGRNNNMDKNEMQKSIDQIGMEGVVKYMPKGMKLRACEVHGNFLAHYSNNDPMCPLCIPSAPEEGTNNGTTATSLEHFIDMGKPGISDTIANQEAQRISDKNNGDTSRAGYLGNI